MFPDYSIASADNAFDALVYGSTHQNTVNFLRNQFNTFSNTLMDSAKGFFEKGRDLFEKFHSSEAMRFARSVVNEALGQTEVKGEYIASIFELNQFQTANLCMQRWVMANPVVRQQYHDQLCDGYSATYVDMEPGLIGDQHYDYRRVMDGMLQIEEDNWKIVQYLEELKEGDRDLLLEEKADIQQSWTWLEYLMTLGQDDPTSPHGSML